MLHINLVIANTDIDSRLNKYLNNIEKISNPELTIAQLKDLIPHLSDSAEKAKAHLIIGALHIKKHKNYQALKYLKKADHPSLSKAHRFILYFHLGQTHYHLTEFQKASDAYKQAELLVSYVPDATTDLHLRYGNALVRLSQHDDAIARYNKALNTSKNLPHSESVSARVYNNIGAIYRQTGRFQLALKNSFNALKISLKNENTHFLGAIYNNIGVVYTLLLDFEKSIAFFKKAVEAKIEANQKHLLASSYSGIADGLIALKQFTDAKKYALLTLDSSTEHQNILGTIIANIALGKIEYHQDNHIDAIKYFNKSLALTKKHKNQYYFSSTLYFIGECYKKLGKHQQAIEYFLQSIKVSKDIENIEYLAKAYFSLSDVYHSINMHQESYLTLLSYINAYKKIFNKEEKNKISELKILHETEQKQAEINTLNKQRKIENLMLENAKSRNKMDRIIKQFSLALVILMSFIIFLFYKKARLALKANKLILEKNRYVEDANKKLESMAKRDPLSNLYNRRAMQEFFERHLDTIKKTHSCFSIAIVDIDHFKRINDQWGHEMGDNIIIAVSNILNESTRGDDVVGRWGGEEFLIFCPNTDQKGAIHYAERVKETISAAEYRINDRTFRITVTIGISAGDYHVNDINHIIKCADEALYQGKASGRNQVCVKLLEPQEENTPSARKNLSPSQHSQASSPAHTSTKTSNSMDL